jgi:hypothetical protein
MAGPLAAEFKIAHQVGVEEHDGFGGQGTVLRRPERQDIDAGTPGDVAWMAVEECQRIGKACTVHVHSQSKITRQLADGGDLGRPVRRAQLGCLGQRHDCGLHRMDVGRMLIHRSPQCFARQLAMLSG